MREFATTLEERQRQARIHAERYWTDESYRLRNINRWRRWKGREPYTSIEQVKTQGPRA
jgi:hypothetical protein